MNTKNTKNLPLKIVFSPGKSISEKNFDFTTKVNALLMSK